MKLYGFRPDRYGPLSYFTIAETEVQARETVRAYIAKADSEHDLRLWDEGHWTVETAELGEVLDNDNA